MATIEELVLALTAETSGLRSEMASAVKATEGATKQMEKAVSEFSKNAEKDTSFFQKSMETMAGFLSGEVVLGAFEKVKEAAHLVYDQLKEGVVAAGEQEAAFVKLANAMALNGKYTEEGQKSLEGFIDKMESLTGVNDTVIAGNLSLLASMTKLDANGLQKAEQAALDLSSAYGIDLDTAVRLVGKGIDGNTEAFKRYGIEVQAGGSKAQNFDNVLKALSNTNGAAVANMQTFQGAVKLVGTAWDNLTKDIGKAVVQNPVVVKALQEVVRIIDDLKDSASANGPALQKGIANALLTVIDVLGIGTEAVSIFIKTFQAGFDLIMVAVAPVIDALSDIGDLLNGDIPKDPFKYTSASVSTLNDTLTKNNALDDFAEKLAQVRVAAESGFGELGKAADAATAPTVRTGKAVAELTAIQKAQRDANGEFAKGLIDDSINVEAQYGYQKDSLEANLAAQKISFETYKAGVLASQQDMNIAQQAQIDDALKNGLITEEGAQIAKSDLATKYSTDRLKTETDLKNKLLALDQARLKGYADMFGELTVLTQSNNSTLVAIGKAAAIAQATIDGYAAIQKAFAQGGFFGFGMAAAVGVATAANVAKIAGVGFANGTSSVPGMGNKDSVASMLTPGERVVPTTQNDDLTKFLADNKEAGGKNVTINLNINIAPGTGINREQAGDIMEGLNNYIAAGGLKLLGAG